MQAARTENKFCFDFVIADLLWMAAAQSLRGKTTFDAFYRIYRNHQRR
jgi:hypothetical protein